jgi:HSP20 family molecular chaperone IbpA
MDHPPEQKHRAYITASLRLTNSYLSFHRSHVHSLFEELIHKPWGYPQWQPLLDILETQEAFIIQLDLPGVQADDVNIEVHGRTLVIRGKREIRPEQEVTRIHLQERPAGNFVRAVEFEEQLSQDRIKSSWQNGVLTLVVTKVEDK